MLAKTLVTSRPGRSSLESRSGMVLIHATRGRSHDKDTLHYLCGKNLCRIIAANLPQFPNTPCGNMRRFCLYLGLFYLLSSLAIAQSSGWQQLFNGKDLTGWKHVGPGGDTVEDGLIRTHGGMGLLYWTGSRFSNCMIRVVYKMRDT